MDKSPPELSTEAHLPLRFSKATPTTQVRSDGARHSRERAGVHMEQERQIGDVTFMMVAEVAAIMRVSKMTVYRLVHAGELPAVRVGRSFRVPEDAVHAYLNQSYMGTA